MKANDPKRLVEGRLGVMVQAYIPAHRGRFAARSTTETGGETTLIQMWRQAKERTELDPKTKRLAVAVLLQAVKDAQKSGPVGDDAIEWLSTPSDDLQLWLDQAGIKALPPREEIETWRLLSPIERRLRQIGSAAGDGGGSSIVEDEEL